MSFKTNNLVGAYLVPGLPHLLSPEKNKTYQEIHDAIKEVGSSLRAQGAERIVYYSTQWLSVLGLSFQSREHIVGHHVDENWHQLGTLDYEFHVDTELSQKFSSAMQSEGFQTSLVDYDHFPIDTATIVANKLINTSDLPTTMIASHVYSDYGATHDIAKNLSEVIASDNKKTAVVGISLLTTNFGSKIVPVGEESALDSQSQEWNTKFLGLCEGGDYAKARNLIPEMAQSTRTDMGLKTFAFVDGFCRGLSQPAQIKAYGGVAGAGACVMEFQG